MKRFVVGIVVFAGCFAHAGEIDKQISKKEYVELWRTTAVQQMIQYKIPASITIAQGILESGSGNSVLAVKGKNHFGIKCHNDWDGETMLLDDDAKGECFRVYKSAEESYVDHSEFLTTKKRYGNLFLLEQDDYKSWAKGLKEAGYATNPKYPEMLIEIIEDLKLNELDVIGTPNNEKKPESLVASNELSISKHSVLTNENKVKYIVARKGDTYYRIATEFNIGLWQLYKYNDFGDKKDVLVEGDIVYVQPKRKRSKTKSIQLTKAMSLREVSQNQGIQVGSLKKLNQISSEDQILVKGENVTLR